MNKVTIKTMRLENFKGVQIKEINFCDRMLIFGQNGSGKTTIADAFYWVFADKGYALKTKESIRPRGSDDETIPRVDITLDLNGAEIVVAKEQKQTTKESVITGATTVTTTNTYYINGAKKSEKDFKSSLNELGLDLNAFLVLSHPEVFTDGKTEDMRKVLFDMADSKTDLDLARSKPELSELAELLEERSVNDIKVEYKSQLKPTKESIDTANAMIKKAMLDLDNCKEVSDLELQINSLNEQIKSLESQLDECENPRVHLKKLIREMQDKKEEIAHNHAMEHNTQKRRKEQIVADLEVQYSGRQRADERYTREEKELQERLSELVEEIRKLRAEFGKMKDYVPQKFDESDCICPTCGQRFSKDRISEIKVAFEENEQLEKALHLEKVKRFADLGNAKIAEKKEVKKQLEDKIKKHEIVIRERDELEKKVAGAKMRVKYPLYKPLKEEVELETLIAEKQKELSELPEQSFEKKDALVAQIDELKTQRDNAHLEIRLFQNTQNILDENNAELSKAKAKLSHLQMILDQLDTLSMTKNNLLTDEVNSHFDGVKVQLFTYQKNGECKDSCDWLVQDGNEWKRVFGESNTALSVRAKLAIIQGLQSFYRVSLPVFVDRAECLDSDNLKQIKADCQLIFLKVVDEKKLSIEPCD